MTEHPPRRAITCVCCGKKGLHSARGLRDACYQRHRKYRTLDKYPRTPLNEPWTPATSRGKETLDQYAELVSLGFSVTRIAWELGVGKRAVYRYAAAYAAQQAERAQAVAA